VNCGLISLSLHESHLLLLIADYLTQDLIESQDIMEDEATFSARAQRARGREHDQREGMATLGLSEVEAVEYVLMLSREEANERARYEASAENEAAATSNSHDVDEGVFEGDFDGDGRLDGGDWRPQTPANSRSAPSIVSSGSSSSFSSGRSSVTTSPGIGLVHPIPRMGISRFSPSSSSSTNAKIQISPPYRAEPLEAAAEGEGREDEQGTRFMKITTSRRLAARATMSTKHRS
jgi:hypothetical protein